MTIVLNDAVAIWSVGLSDGDWLAAVLKTSGELEAVYRFRWYKDKRTFDSADIKNWYKIKLKGGQEVDYIKQLRDIYEVVQRMFGADRGWEIIRGERSEEEFGRLLLSMPGITSKTVSSAPLMKENQS